MKLLVIGALGKLGRELVGQGIARGHAITALVRRDPPPGVLPSEAWVERGDLLDARTLGTALAGQEAVVAAVAARPRLGRHAPLYEPGSRSLTQAMTSAGVSRLLWVSSAAVDPADLAATAWAFRRVIEPLFLRGVYADAAAAEVVLQGTALEWTAVRPVQLTDAPATGRWRLDSHHTPKGGRTIGRADVAQFMLDEVENGRHLRGTPVIAV